MKCDIKTVVAFMEQENAFCSEQWYRDFLFDCLNSILKSRIVCCSTNGSSDVWNTKEQVEVERNLVYREALIVFRAAKYSMETYSKAKLKKQYQELLVLENEKNKFGFWRSIFCHPIKYRCLIEQIMLKKTVQLDDVILALRYECGVCMRYQRHEFYEMCAKIADDWL